MTNSPAIVATARIAGIADPANTAANEWVHELATNYDYLLRTWTGQDIVSDLVYLQVDDHDEPVLWEVFAGIEGWMQFEQGEHLNPADMSDTMRQVLVSVVIRYYTDVAKVQ